MTVTVSVLKFFIIFITCINASDDMPTVDESWIFAMVVFGFIGSITLIFLIVFAMYKTWNSQSPALQRKQDRSKMIINIILTFSVWILNAFACLEWAFLRTDLFIELNETKCTVIYISNYLFYMLAKYALHILLLYRLYLAFRGTALRINNITLKSFGALITIDLIVFVGLWLNICLHNVSVGIIIPSETLRFCTLYNNVSTAEMSLYQKIWPILFGAQDFIVGMVTLILFIYKLKQSTRGVEHDLQREALVRRLVILGMISILSTFMLFTFAVPFYSNLTFLLPFDALINSICVALLLDWMKALYHRVCCAMDICLQTVFDHESTRRDDVPGIILDGVNISLENKTNPYNLSPPSQLNLDDQKPSNTTSQSVQSSQPHSASSQMPQTPSQKQIT